MTWRNHRGEIVTPRGDWKRGKFRETPKRPEDRIIQNERIAGAPGVSEALQRQGRGK